jgi:hypothetical protein
MVDDMAILDQVAADTGGDVGTPEAAGVPTEPAAAGSEAVGEQPSVPVLEENTAASPTGETGLEIEYPDEPPEADPEVDPEPEAAPAKADSEPGSQRFGTAALTRMLKDNPELEKAAASSPRIKAQLYQMARRSQELQQYQDLVPSLSRAREAVEKAQAIDGFDQSFFGNQPEQFWSRMHAAAGSSGAYERNVQFLQQTFLDAVAERAAQGGDNSLSGAVTAIREALGWGTSSRTPDSRAAGDTNRGTSEQDLPVHIRQQLQELEQLRRRRSDEERQAEEHFLDDTAQEAGRAVRGFVEGILAQARLSDYDRQNVVRDFMEEVARLADEDKVHNAALDDLYRQGGATPATRAQMIARVTQWTRQNGREVLEPILRKAGAGLKQRQQQREAVTAKARSEPRASGMPGALTQPAARDLVRSQEQKLGRRLTDREVLDLG